MCRKNIKRPMDLECVERMDNDVGRSWNRGRVQIRASLVGFRKRLGFDSEANIGYWNVHTFIRSHQGGKTIGGKSGRRKPSGKTTAMVQVAGRRGLGGSGAGGEGET